MKLLLLPFPRHDSWWQMIAGEHKILASVSKINYLLLKFLIGKLIYLNLLACGFSVFALIGAIKELAIE